MHFNLDESLRQQLEFPLELVMYLKFAGGISFSYLNFAGGLNFAGWPANEMNV